MRKKIQLFYYFNIAIFVVALVLVFVLGFISSKSLDTIQVSAEEEEKDLVPPILYNVQINSINATSSIITWETDENADSLINYGLDKEYGIVRDPRADKVEHMIILEKLLPDTTYFFRITSSDESGNQGLSSDFSFTTLKEIEEEEFTEVQEDVTDQGKAGLNEIGVTEILEAIKEVTEEETLEIIEEQLRQTAEAIVTPPTIILDYADVEAGIDYAIISWATDKESDSIVSLAEEDDYDEESADPYVWQEGDRDELVLEHVVEVRGLSPATEYHFQVSSKSALDLTGKSTDKTFKTKSIAPEIYNIHLTKIEEESATIRYTTNIPCSSIIEYTNLDIGQSKLEGNSSFFTFHTVRLTNLTFDTYYSFVIKAESEDGENAESDPVTFITIKDEEPPVISKVNTESTIYPGSENKIQTIASWSTDEPAQCQLFYHQGLVLVDEPDSQPKEEDFTVKHVQVNTAVVSLPPPQPLITHPGTPI